ncbi:MAG: hypothetical protein IT372_36535 [Polyangiaceae bacterium]|nr:hypothetical protein [Polyangiaceae bacterium]
MRRPALRSLMMIPIPLLLAAASPVAGAEPPGPGASAGTGADAKAGPKADAKPQEQADAKPADDVAERVRRLRAEGDMLFAKGDLKGARAAYLEIWRLKKEYGIARDLGHVEAKLGMHRDAAERLSFYLREAPADEPGRARAQALFHKARTHVAEIRLTMDVPGATMEVDYVKVGPSPLPGPIYLDPGQHVLQAFIDRWADSVNCWFYAGESSTVALSSPPPDADDAEMLAWVERRSQKFWAQREAVKRAYGDRRPPPPPAPPPPPPPEEPEKSMFVVGLGSSAALVTMSMGLLATLLANGRSDAVDAMRVGRGGASECYRSTSEDCRVLGAAVSRLDDYTTAAGVLWASGVLLAGATVAYAILPMPWEERSALRAAPWVGASGAGVSVGSRF